jgi:hypothetical protein
MHGAGMRDIALLAKQSSWRSCAALPKSKSTPDACCESRVAIIFAKSRKSVAY